MRRASKFGRKVAVDFESDADFHKCRRCPGFRLDAPSGSVSAGLEADGLRRWPECRDGGFSHWLRASVQILAVELGIAVAAAIRQAPPLGTAGFDARKIISKTSRRG
jgi:hypothetical protein